MPLGVEATLALTALALGISSLCTRHRWVPLSACGLVLALLLRREWMALSLMPMALLVGLGLWRGGIPGGARGRLAALVLLRLFVFFQLAEGYMALCQRGILASRFYWNERWIGGVPLTVEGAGSLGRIPPAGFKCTHISRLNDYDTDWSATYTTDARGRRTVKGQKSGAKGLVLVGDSFTFGYGVDDDRTVASQLQGLLERPVINLGCNGHGPSRNLLALEREDGWPWLEPADEVGDVVYMSLPHHLYDNDESKAWRIFAVPGETVFVGGPGEMQRRIRGVDETKSMGSMEVFLHRHVRLMKLTKLYQRPERVDDAWISLCVDYCLRMREVASARLGARFHVALLRSHHMGGLETEAREFKRRLRMAGIDVLDYQDLPGDGLRENDFDITSRHFTGSYSGRIARALMGDLAPHVQTAGIK
ncbi:MAG: hypothetical protein AB7F75_02000 [Planctomycetota bacterium]